MIQLASCQNVGAYLFPGCSESIGYHQGPHISQFMAVMLFIWAVSS